MKTSTLLATAAAGASLATVLLLPGPITSPIRCPIFPYPYQTLTTSTTTSFWACPDLIVN